MFTLAISYLIFSASSFRLISTMITKTAKSLIGADIQVRNTNSFNFLDEIPMSEFLDQQMQVEG